MTRIIRTTERRAFMECPEKWRYAFEMGLRKKGDTPDALWLGIGVHEALAMWYQPGLERGPHPATTFAEWTGDVIRKVRATSPEGDTNWYDDTLWLEARDLGVAMLNGYVDKYGTDPDLDILATEQPFEVDIVHEGKIIATLVGTVDGLAQLPDGTVAVLEHKTASSISTRFLAIDPQAGGYLAAATVVFRHQGLIGEDQDIGSTLYNYLLKSLPDDRPVNEQGQRLNKDGTISKNQGRERYVREFIDRLPSEAQAEMSALADEVFLMNEMRAGRIPVILNRTYRCPSCPYFDLCVMKMKGRRRAYDEIMKSEFTTEDPYAAQYGHLKNASDLGVAKCRQSKEELAGHRPGSERTSSARLATDRGSR